MANVSSSNTTTLYSTTQQVPITTGAPVATGNVNNANFTTLYGQVGQLPSAENNLIVNDLLVTGNAQINQNLTVLGSTTLNNTTINGQTFPLTDGLNGQVLTTDGAGNLYWSTNAGTTYTIDASVVAGGADLNLTGSDLSVDTIKFQEGSGIQIVATDANTIEITNTSVGTTYTIDASATAGGANFNLVGSDLTTDTIEFVEGTGVTLTVPTGSEIEIAIGQDVATTANPQFAGATLGNVTVGVATDNTISTTSGDLILDSVTNALTINAATDITEALTTQAGVTARIINNSGSGVVVPFTFETYATTTPPAFGFGGGFDFDLSNNAYATKTALQLYSKWTDATAGAEDALLWIGLTNNGSTPLVPQFQFTSDGNLSVTNNISAGNNLTVTNDLILAGNTFNLTPAQQGQFITYNGGQFVNTNYLGYTSTTYRPIFESMSGTGSAGINNIVQFTRDRLTSNFVDNDGAALMLVVASNAQGEQVVGHVAGTYHSTNGQSVLLRPYNSGAFQDCFTANRNTTIVTAENFVVENTSGTDNLTVDTSGNVVVAGDLAVNGGDLTTTQTTFNLLDTTATTVNAFGAATTIDIGAATGTTTINNDLTVDGSTTIKGSTSGYSTFSAPATGSNLTYVLPGVAGAASTVLTNDGSGNLSWALPGGGGSTFGNITVGVVTDNTISTTTGDLVLDSSSNNVSVDADLTTPLTTFNLINTTATTVNAFGAATTVNIGNASGNVVVAGDLQVTGNDIKASTGNTNITLTDNTLTAFAGDIQVNGNDVLNSTGNTAITMATGASPKVTLAGNLQVTGTNIQGPGFGGTTIITLAALGNLCTFAGDIRVNGNDIQASDGNNNITMTSNTLTAFAGDIKVGGNDIQASDGNNNITMTSNTLTTFAGDIKVTGNDIQDSTGTNAVTLIPNGVRSQRFVRGAIRDATADAAGDIGSLAGVAYSGVSLSNDTGYDTTLNAFWLRNYSQSGLADPRTLMLMEGARGTSASPLAITTNNQVFRLVGSGYNGTNWITDTAATGGGVVFPFELAGVATQTWTNTVWGTKMRVRVQPNGVTASSAPDSRSTIIDHNPASTSFYRSDSWSFETREANAGGTGTVQFTVDSSGNMVLTGDLRINGNDIQASDGNTNITLTSNTLTAFAGDIKVTGNDIQNSTGNNTITMAAGANALTTFAGDIKVSGNDIQNSAGDNNIQLSSTNTNINAEKINFNDPNANSLNYIQFRPGNRNTNIQGGFQLFNYTDPASPVAPFANFGQYKWDTTGLVFVPTSAGESLGGNYFFGNSSSTNTLAQRQIGSWTVSAAETITSTAWGGRVIAATNRIGTNANVNVIEIDTSNGYLRSNNWNIQDNASNNLVTIDTSGNVNITGDLTVGGNIIYDYTAYGDGRVSTTSTSLATLDSWATATYQSASYSVTVKDTVTSAVQMAKIDMFHTGGTAYINQYSNMNSGATPLVTFSATISGSNAVLQITPASTNNTQFTFSRIVTEV